MDLQQPTKEGNIVSPFLLCGIPKGKSAFDTGGVPAESFISLEEG